MFRTTLIAILVLATTLCVSAAESYKRIVSLAPSLTQSIYDMGAQSLLVGCTSYCHAAKSDNKPIVASAVKPNLEKIVSLKPDLVLASGLTSIKDIETLRKFGIHVEVFTTSTSFEKICSQFETIGRFTGKTDEANSILTTSRAKIKELQASMKKRGFKVFIQIGASPIFAVIPNTFMDDYITLSGGENIAKELTHGTISRELVIARRPDYIFIVTMGMAAEEEKAEWQKYQSIPAVKNNKIEIIDSNVACLPTPLTFVKTLEIITKYISR